MKSFQFESISLLSHRDKKARKVIFHPRRNLIQGENHTGKSSIVKNLFIALGATPAGKLEHWDPESVISVKFNVDGKLFLVIHHKGARALYDASETLLTATDSHAVWSNTFADLVGFKLVVTAKKDGSGVCADPSCFFLPFYIDQDGSWRDKWETFPAMLRFSAPVPSILEYFSGIKPAEYYELKSQLVTISKEADRHMSDMKLLERARIRLNQALPLGGVNLSEEGFEEEIGRLTVEANELSRQQEILRHRYVRESEIVTSISCQIDVAYASLREYAGDKKFLTKAENAHDLVCPTCGAEHEQSFLHYLGYAEDARILEELTRSLINDLSTAKQELTKTSDELKLLRGSYSRINSILEKQKGALKFREVVESQGSQMAHRAFDVERDQINVELGYCNAQLQNVNTRLNELTNKKRAKKIVDEFRDAYQVSRKALNVPDPSGRINLNSRPNRSGSGGPRLVLAYYAALWKVCQSNQLNVSIPVVIDSPNQQDQDDVNLHVVLEFIADSLPASMQLIVCVTKDSDARLDKKMVFDEKYSVLQRQNYDEVEAEIGPLYRRMNEALLAIPVSDD